MIRRTALAILGTALAIGCGGAAEQAREPSPGEPEAPVTADTSRLLEEVTGDWGVRFEHHSGATGALLFPEMIGGGVAIFDADGDGDLDLYFANGSPLSVPDALPTPDPAHINRLFVQVERGRFEDRSADSGLDDTGYSAGVAVGDFDNDGLDDVYVANYGSDRLYRNLGGGTFEDVTASAGIPSSDDPFTDWSTSAAFCDYDRDGHLDLYVVHYVDFDPEVSCTDTAGRREYCGPASFTDSIDRLLRNRGDGRFEDVTGRAGIAAVTGAGLGVVCEDLDADGWMDFYVANDGDPNQLWINQRDGTFLDDAVILGASANAAGLAEAGMGVVAADFDNDLDADLFVTHLRDETNTFYRNLGPGVGFEDQTAQAGLTTASSPYTGFGTAPVDLDLDGDLDLVITNGRVTRGDPLTDQLDPAWNAYGEPNLVYANDAGRFRVLGAEVAAFTAPVEVGRGLATGDLDGDGALDFVVSSIGSPARIYRSTPPSRHWLLVDAFDPEVGRRALGARVTVAAGDATQIRSVHGAMSYLSSSDPRAHFGLGDHASPVTVTIRWPDGTAERFDDVAIDRAVTLERGTGSQP